LVCTDRFISVSVLLIMLSIVGAQDGLPSGPPVEVLVRCDDIGMSHSVNRALEEVIAEGIPNTRRLQWECT
jgi:hypothetical protein